MIEGVRTYLLADAAIAALVGTRVRSDGLEQGEPMPAIAMWAVGGGSEANLDEAAGQGTIRLQIDCYASTRLGANALAELVRVRMQQRVAGGTMGSVIVDGCLVVGGPRYDRDKPVNGSDEWRYMTSREFEIVHQEAT